jgi:ribosomal protein L20
LKNAGVALDRKALAGLAMEDPKSFQQLAALAKEHQAAKAA